MAQSTLPNAGSGVFSHQPTQNRSVVLQLPARLAELSQLSSYVFGMQSDGEAMSQVMLGVGSLVNHGASNQQVNCDLQLDYQGFGILRARRELTPGEELFISYGTSEWFTDRGLVSQPVQTPVDRQAGGHCLSHLQPDPSSLALLAASHIVAEEHLRTPAFLIASDVAHESMLPYALVVEEVMILPLWPGRLAKEDKQHPANVRLEVLADGLPVHLANVKAHDVCDSTGTRIDVVMTALRDISKGERLIAADCAEGCLFPSGWATNLTERRQQAAEAGDVRAQFQLAQRWRQGVPSADMANSTEALTWYLQAAKQNHTQAMLQLGALLHDGDSLHPGNASSAFDWYLAAAQRGSATGQFLVGLAYSNGDGVAKNISKASKWLSLAASQGSSNFAKASKAMYNLAIFYREGLGVARDVEKAFYWCRKAAEQGDHDKAMYNLATAYSRGDGTCIDFEEAANWYQRAADMGHTMAQYNLGYSYLVGQGRQTNAALAAQWFQRAAEGNSSNGQFMMGLLHSQGRGVAADPEMAVQWYRRAAEQDQGQAQYKLAAALEAGHGVPSDQAEADYWYAKAAVHGYKRSHLSSLWHFVRGLFSTFSRTSRGKEL